MAKPGTYEDVKRAPEVVIEGMRARLEWGSKRNEETGCLEWMGRLTAWGYVPFYALARYWYGHRLKWMLERGEIPAGYFVCHHCDNRKCIEVGHLFLGTSGDNAEDMWTKGRNAPPEVTSRKKRPKEEIVKRICDLRVGGAPYREISEVLGIGTGMVYAVCKEAGVEVIGELHGKKVWQAEWTAEALEMQKAGKKLREIGERFGVTGSTVHNYIGSKRERVAARAMREAIKAEEAGPLDWLDEPETGPVYDYDPEFKQ